MNVADSQRLGSALERLGYEFTGKAEDADVIVLNTCVVRQSAEDKAYGRLSSLRPLKTSNPSLVINLMGCLVGIRDTEKLRTRFPFVDVFSPPSDPGPLISFLTQGEARALDVREIEDRFAYLDGDLVLPEHERGTTVSVFMPVVLGCSHACTFCIIPSRRGVERSRPADEIADKAHSLAAQGVKEITLLGQIVDRYGKDQPEGPNLAALLHGLTRVEGLERIRFLTSHPNYFGEDIMDTVAELPKVMPHIEIPIQAGDDEILKKMRRGYTQADYRRIISFSPAVTETIYKLGGQDRLAGIASFSDFPPEAEKEKPTVGGILNIDSEKVLSLKPDLIISPPGAIASEKLPQFGADVKFLPDKTLADVRNSFVEIGRLIGKPAEGARLAEALRVAVAAAAKRSAGHPRVGVLVVIGYEPMWVAGGYGVVNELIEAAGGKNVAGKVEKDFYQIDFESVLQSAPEVIVDVTLHAPITAEKRAPVASFWRRFGTVPAVKNGAIEFLDTDLLTIPGPRLIDGLAALEEALHGRYGKPRAGQDESTAPERSARDAR